MSREDVNLPELFPLRLWRTEKFLRIECDLCHQIVFAAEVKFLSELLKHTPGMDQQRAILLGCAVLAHRHGGPQ